MNLNPFFTFGGVASSDFSTLAFPDNAAMDTPERNAELVEIDGRNGDLVIDKGNFKNRTISIKCICRQYKEYYQGFRAWLLESAAYKRLELASDPEVYLMARCDSVQTDKVLRDTATCTVTFTAKPQKYLKAGEMPTTLTASGKIRNLTAYPSKPLLEVTGTGTVTIADQTIKIKSNAAGMTIDTEIMEAYNGASWLNGDVELPDEFSIPAGVSSVILGSSIKSLKITPRWWTI